MTPTSASQMILKVTQSTSYWHNVFQRDSDLISSNKITKPKTPLSSHNQLSIDSLQLSHITSGDEWKFPTMPIQQNNTSLQAERWPLFETGGWTIMFPNSMLTCICNHQAYAAIRLFYRLSDSSKLDHPTRIPHPHHPPKKWMGISKQLINY